MAVAPITMTTVRKAVVEFSNAFQEVSVTALIKADSNIKSFEDLLKANLTYVTLREGSTAQGFKSSREYQRIWAAMESKNSFASSMEDGKKMVLEGNYAFFIEKHTAEYTIAQDCRFEMVGSILPSGGYAFPVKKRSTKAEELLKSVNRGIADLKRDGTLEKMEDQWWAQQECSGSTNIITSFVLILTSLVIALGL